jgi:alkanesulfonate monooxygenase SsuD/methylene tetrahydromethanopterin reductase-like flavin-dependent oxidoreductase (luciferase family)
MGKLGHNFYNELFQRYGFGEEVAVVQQLFLERRRNEAAAAVTDAMVDSVTIIGDVDECRARLGELEACGIDEVALQLALPDHSPPKMLAAMEALAA